MRRSIRRLLLILLAGSLLCLVFLFVRPFLGIFADMIYASSPRFWCSNLPPAAQVEQALQDHAGLVRQIEEADTYVDVEINRPEKCPDKAYLLILHSTQAGREAIERMIGEKLFFGIPYLFANV